MPDYALFHIVPSIGSWERLRKGLPHFGFDTTLPVYLGVLPRRADATAQDIHWFKRGNCSASHVLNAFQDGTKIRFDTPEAKNNMFPFFPDVHGAPFRRRRGHELPDALDGGHELEFAGADPDRAPDRHRGRISAHRRSLRRRAVPARLRLEMDLRRPVELRGGSAGGLLMNCLFHQDLGDREQAALVVRPL